jgi:hypothetical protein
MQLHARLKQLDMKPSREFTLSPSQEGQSSSDWSRQWLVIKDVKLKKLAKSGKNERYFEIEDIKIGVEARQLEKDS